MKITKDEDERGGGTLGGDFFPETHLAKGPILIQVR